MPLGVTAEEARQPPVALDERAHPRGLVDPRVEVGAAAVALVVAVHHEAEAGGHVVLQAVFAGGQLDAREAPGGMDFGGGEQHQHLG